MQTPESWQSLRIAERESVGTDAPRGRGMKSAVRSERPHAKVYHTKETLVSAHLRLLFRRAVALPLNLDAPRSGCCFVQEAA
jgi:hypothetical protein